MPGNRTGCDNIVRVIELHKVGKSYREIEKATGVNESTVGRLVKTMARIGEGGGENIPVHEHAGGKALKISTEALRLLRCQLDLTL